MSTSTYSDDGWGSSSPLKMTRIVEEPSSSSLSSSSEIHNDPSRPNHVRFVTNYGMASRNGFESAQGMEARNIQQFKKIDNSIFGIKPNLNSEVTKSAFGSEVGKEYDFDNREIVSFPARSSNAVQHSRVINKVEPSQPKVDGASKKTTTAIASTSSTSITATPNYFANTQNLNNATQVPMPNIMNGFLGLQEYVTEITHFLGPNNSLDQQLVFSKELLDILAETGEKLIKLRQEFQARF